MNATNGLIHSGIFYDHYKTYVFPGYLSGEQYLIWSRLYYYELNYLNWSPVVAGISTTVFFIYAK